MSEMPLFKMAAFEKLKYLPKASAAANEISIKY